MLAGSVPDAAAVVKFHVAWPETFTSIKASIPIMINLSSGLNFIAVVFKNYLLYNT
jgi:hypothetical protein